MDENKKDILLFKCIYEWQKDFIMVGGDLNYFYNYINIAQNAWAINYNFSSPSGSGLNVPSTPSGNSLYSGKLSSIGNYYSNSGSGNFSGQTINIQNASGLSSNTFTMIFGYEKPASGNCILFSSLQSGANISGIIIGVNDSNKIYSECYDQNGPSIVTSSNIISSKNAIAIVKSNNILNFHYYNFNYQQVESETFNISSSALYNSNQCYIAGTGTNTPPYINQKNFSGYLSEFIYINIPLTQNTVQKLFSGFYATKNSPTTGIISYSSGAGFITGGQSIYTGIGTGITGEQVFLAGTYLDFCGNPHPIYSYTNMTGIISGYKFFPLTGNIIFTGTGLIDQGYNINTGFAATFGMDGFVYNRYILSTDFSELYTFPAPFIQNLNNEASYNLDGTYRLNMISTNGQFNLYDNGLANFPSGFNITGNIYQQYLILQGDYYTSGASIVSTGVYQGTDIIIYDYITGISEIFNYTGNSQTFSTTYPSNRMIFLNGQKLISGFGYTFSANNLLINLSGYSSGIITSLSAQTGFLYNSGNFINLLSEKFDRAASQLWMNGQRQLINYDYYEISKIDLLNGSGLFATFPATIYNNNGQFLQPF